ncbi:hypothetical protein BA190_09330 [Labrys sp. WJW]|uniref:hypothetical protein n=1 Tax=Labrys sp. WJW TaxID=1737983 RepID=UPI00082D52CF|nr:hypothetical protein [Labrys sp. WJW]OCC05107.1 hypothetical protein BA190_09330 [Labrys sp. WJW]
MSFATNIQNLATRIATEFKAVRTLVNGNAGDLSGLTTTAKANLVAAINEVKAAVSAASGIDDGATSTGSTWSSSKIQQTLTAAIDGILNGVPSALDTLQELAAALGNDANFSGTVTTALGNRVRFDAAQTLTAPQQAQACANIGVGDPATNFVTTFEAGLA